jgi:APA family basic amino acid/polyamine antiporter
VFAIVNGALIILKRRPGELKGAFEVPMFVPILGSAICVVLIASRLASEDWHAPAIAGALLAGIVAIYAVLRPKAIDTTEE